MKTLGQLLGSAARADVLHVLYCEPEPVGLRHVARLAGLYPRSVQLALAGLVDDCLVVCDRTGARPLYQLDRNHSDAPILAAVFRAVAEARIRSRCSCVQDRAQSILPFINEAMRMLSVSREDLRVT